MRSFGFTKGIGWNNENLGGMWGAKQKFEVFWRSFSVIVSNIDSFTRKVMFNLFSQCSVQISSPSNRLHSPEPSGTPDMRRVSSHRFLRSFQFNLHSLSDFLWGFFEESIY